MPGGLRQLLGSRRVFLAMDVDAASKPVRRNGVFQPTLDPCCECAVSRPVPPYLKLRTAEDAEPARPDLADIACLGELCQAFADATGWPLRYVPEPEPSEPIDLLWSAPVNPGVGVPPGHLRIDLSGPIGESSRVDWDAAQRMAGAAAELVNELVKARFALWQREAELAASVPVGQHRDEEGQLAARLEATLRAGAKAIGCQAAALYMLDDATSQLKLRSAWGLPIGSFTQSPRPLAEQMADLEALLGHAVALESRRDMTGPWRSPELASAALCVPVSSPTVPLGTLWFFSARERKFTDDQTNIAEVVAGKIASDLERTVLLQEHVAQRRTGEPARPIDRDETGRASTNIQLPKAPPLEGWSMSGWAEQAGQSGGAFYDWRMLSDTSLLAMLGDACEGGYEAALASTALRAALRMADLSQAELADLLERVNQALWEVSAGGWWGGLWLGKIDLAKGRCDFATAGRPAVWWLRIDGWASLAKPSEPLGLEPNIKRKPRRVLLAPGESIVVCNRGLIDATGENGRPLDQAAIAEALIQQQMRSPAPAARSRRKASGQSAASAGNLSAEKMLEILRQEFESRITHRPDQDRAALYIHRMLEG